MISEEIIKNLEEMFELLENHDDRSSELSGG